MSLDALAHYRHTKGREQAQSFLFATSLSILKGLNLTDTKHIQLQIRNSSTTLRTQFSALSLVTKTLRIKEVMDKTFRRFDLSRVLFRYFKTRADVWSFLLESEVRIAFLGLSATIYIFKGCSLLPQVEAPTYYLKRYTCALSLLVNDLSDKSSFSIPTTTKS
jgi:hypothetical protein